MPSGSDAPRKGMRRGTTRRRRPLAAVAAVVAAGAILALVLAGPAFVGLAAAGGLAARSRVAAAATATKTKSGMAGKSGKYVGSINPRLRSLVNSPEYEEVLVLLEKLQSRGELDNFLETLETYLVNLDIIELGLQESQGDGGVVRKIKQDWSRIFPKNTDFRIESFESFARLWVRIGRSKCLDDLMEKVLPQMGGDYRDMMENEDQKKLMDMTPTERESEILYRMSNSPMIMQLAVLTSENKIAQKISPAVAPVLQRLMIQFERKMAEQTDKLGTNLDLAVYAVLAVVLLAAVYVLGVVKLPF